MRPRPHFVALRPRPQKGLNIPGALYCLQRFDAGGRKNIQSIKSPHSTNPQRFYSGTGGRGVLAAEGNQLTQIHSEKQK